MYKMSDNEEIDEETMDNIIEEEKEDEEDDNGDENIEEDDNDDENIEEDDNDNIEDDDNSFVCMDDMNGCVNKKHRKKHGISDNMKKKLKKINIQPNETRYKHIDEYRLMFKKILKNEHNIFNAVLRNIKNELNRNIKMKELNNDMFKKKYVDAVYNILNNPTYDLKNGVDFIGFENEIMMEENEIKNIENPQTIQSGLYICSKCKNNPSLSHDDKRGTRTTYFEKQTRSCDEPMTVFILCMDCGKRWKN